MLCIFPSTIQTEILWISEKTTLLIYNVIVDCVHECKYLGKNIDVQFSFNLNITNLYKKPLSKMYFVKQLS